MQTDVYRTIADKTEGIFKDKGSKFLAFAYPVDEETTVHTIYQKLKNEYHDARHHCYAYRIGTKDDRYRANDDGEPSNSAGKPILGQIHSKELTNVLVVVVRYFGGTLLGIGGLINAYKTAAKEALDEARIIEKTINNIAVIRFSYEDTNETNKIIKEEDIKTINTQFDAHCTFTLGIRRSRFDQILQRLQKVASLKILDTQIIDL